MQRSLLRFLALVAIAAGNALFAFAVD